MNEWTLVFKCLFYDESNEIGSWNKVVDVRRDFF